MSDRRRFRLLRHIRRVLRKRRPAVPQMRLLTWPRDAASIRKLDEMSAALDSWMRTAPKQRVTLTHAVRNDRLFTCIAIGDTGALAFPSFHGEWP